MAVLSRILGFFLSLSLGCAGSLHGRANPCSSQGRDVRDQGSHLALGMCWEREGKVELALSEYRKALVVSPHETEARERLALGYLQIGDDLFAAREFLFLLNDDPDNITALFKLGTIFYRQAKEDLAISSFSRILEIDHGHSKAWYNLGAIYANRSGKNDREKAESHFRMYMKQVPGSREEKAAMERIEKWMQDNETHGHHRTGGEKTLPLQ